MTEESSIPKLNLYAISFPSDKLTLGQMRKLDQTVSGSGEVFSSSEKLHDARAAHIHSFIPLSYEMLLAEKAYAKSLGLSEPWPLTSRSELVGLLRQQWEEDGISSGPELSKQFIRDIEQAAIKQAKKHLGTEL